MPPAPVSNFTIPSIHDDIPLDCRIYHPSELSFGKCLESEWQKKGAIVAHPYAPLGGCQDDPVVQSAVTELLKQGFVVGTFNFRSSSLPFMAFITAADGRLGEPVARKVGPAGLENQN
jgi:hypothetical protein